MHHVTQTLIAMQNALERRWEACGSPAHATELCLWELSAQIDGPEPTYMPEELLSEAVALLQDWIDCGELITEDEVKALEMAQQHHHEISIA